MKQPYWIVLIALLGVLAGCAAPPAQPPTATPPPTPTPQGARAGWVLVWQDEFDGPEIDDGKWSFEVNGRGGGNNEMQYYTDRPENAFIEDGKLVIQALAEEEKYIGKDYTSARMRSLGKGDWTYGRFEARARLPTGRGLWPAIWMLPSLYEYGGWPESGEIDIVELVGHEPDVVHGTIHYGSIANHIYTGRPYRLAEGIFADDFHIFAVEWEEGEIRWYVDDVLYQTQTSWQTRRADYPAPFDKDFHLILNVAVGGNWPGPPDETTVFPQRMEVDYVRVYQRPAGGAGE